MPEDYAKDHYSKIIEKKKNEQSLALLVDFSDFTNRLPVFRRRVNFALYIPMKLDLMAHDKNVSDTIKSNISELQNRSFIIIVKNFLQNIFP